MPRMSTETVVEDLREASSGMLIAGVLSVIVGAIAIALPALASVSIAILIGILLVVAGVAWLSTAIRGQGNLGWRLTGGVLATLLVIGGIWTLVRPFEATVGLTAILAIVFIVVGVARLATAITHRDGGSTWLVGLGGALSIVIGALIAIEFPDSADWAIGLLVGIQFLFDGIGLVALGYRLRTEVPTPAA
jgi:uncharacterized membrane protein HdeD (DUF308 family)